jgi:hypothetical protein
MMFAARKSVGWRTADGFAVCGFSATLASLFSFARCEQPKQSMQDQKN